MKKIILSALMIFSLPSQAETTLIHAGTLLAVPGVSAKQEQTIVVVDGKVAAVKSGYLALWQGAKADSTINLKNKFVLPGLMDMHVHLQGELGPKNDSQSLRWSAEDVGMYSAYSAAKTLMAGFTTVRDLGAQSPQHIYALRNAINKGWLPGPRIIASGGVSVTGGHGDIDGMRHELLNIYTQKTVCNGPYDCRRATRRAIKFGADVIKITSTGGVLSDTNTGTGQQMADDELKEVVAAAHALGRKVASHAHAAAGINAALRAGVDSIEHGSYADKETIKLLKKNKAFLVPTLLAGDTVVKMAENSNFMSAAIKAKAIRVGGDMLVNFSRAHQAGVKIAYGTDSGVSAHGDNAKEAVLMVAAGMSPMAVIKTATLHAAELLDMQAQLGSVEAGKWADIIAVSKNPLEDIRALQQVDFVMRSGQVYKH